MRRVIGYHGCDVIFAAGVRSGRISLAQWKHSQNAYDWLGEGIYFWEGSRTRAEQWARERFGDRADVLRAEIVLGECLDLLETSHHNSLRATFRRLRTAYRREKWTLPTNNRKRHDLDNFVINDFVKHMATAEKQPIFFQTVRAAFEEGRPLFPGSAIRVQSHIQIAVRDFQCIRSPR